jgi:16S rRNA (uracil1498-N3)-methyltransferase
VPRDPAFFVEGSLEQPSLSGEDADHARRVLRLGVGDRLIGLDGEGGRVVLAIRALGKGRIELEPLGPAVRVPRPGEMDSELPWFELAVAWPRRNRVEDMLSRLVQLGAAAIRPLEARHRGPAEPPEVASERWLRVAREACKQSGRAWMPVFEACSSPAALASARRECPIGVLDPAAALGLDTWLRSIQPSPEGVGTRVRPIVLVVGPEGGFDDEERAAFLEAQATFLWAGPHILRIETAAEAAMAIASVVQGRSRSGAKGP